MGAMAPKAATDAYRVARAVTSDLKDLYGDRLQRVILFGSWARGDADEESDLDLCVVLDDVHSLWEELDRMNKILWRHTFENDIVVTAIPVSIVQLRDKVWPLMQSLEREGRAVA